jgi:hypothetical protein
LDLKDVVARIGAEPEPVDVFRHDRVVDPKGVRCLRADSDLEHGEARLDLGGEPLRCLPSVCELGWLSPSRHQRSGRRCGLARFDEQPEGSLCFCKPQAARGLCQYGMRGNVAF